MKTTYAQGRIIGQVNMARIALEKALQVAISSNDRRIASKIRKAIALIA
jgi:rRNA processing protein Krr1/Pno1